MSEFSAGLATYNPFPFLEEPAPGRTAIDGATFILDAEEEIPAVWGQDGSRVLWPDGEGLMLCGPQGVGKSTIAQQLVLSRIGVQESSLLRLPVKPAESKVLYLAMDRPRQIARSFRRMVSDEAKELLLERLVVWRGPLPFQVTESTHRLADWVEEQAGEHCDVIVDSYKDLASRLSQDDVGAAVNSAVQEVIARGMQWCGLHHQRKANQDNKRPSSLDDVFGSVWLTAGLGSVALLWSKPGSEAIELTHLKQPAEPVGPLNIVHNHSTGSSQVRDENDLLAHLLGADDAGLTEQQVAAYLYGDGEDRNARKKAHRQMDALVKDNVAIPYPGRRGGAGGGGSAPRWVAK